jgi:hypothetical protein
MDYRDFQHSNMQSMDKLFFLKHTVSLTKMVSNHLQLEAEIMATSYRTLLDSYRSGTFSSNNNNKHQSLFPSKQG